MIGEHVELASGRRDRLPRDARRAARAIGARTRISPFAVIGGRAAGAGLVRREHRARDRRGQHASASSSSIHVGSPSGGGSTRIGNENLHPERRPHRARLPDRQPLRARRASRRWRATCVLEDSRGVRGDDGRAPVRAHRRIGIHRRELDGEQGRPFRSRRSRATARASRASTPSACARRGFSDPAIARLKHAFHHPLPLEAARRAGHRSRRSASAATCREVAHLLRFIERIGARLHPLAVTPLAAGAARPDRGVRRLAARDRARGAPARRARSWRWRSTGTPIPHSRPRSPALHWLHPGEVGRHRSQRCAPRACARRCWPASVSKLHCSTIPARCASTPSALALMRALVRPPRRRRSFRVSPNISRTQGIRLLPQAALVPELLATAGALRARRREPRSSSPTSPSAGRSRRRSPRSTSARPWSCAGARCSRSRRSRAPTPRSGAPARSGAGACVAEGRQAEPGPALRSAGDRRGDAAGARRGEGGPCSRSRRARRWCSSASRSLRAGRSRTGSRSSAWPRRPRRRLREATAHRGRRCGPHGAQPRAEGGGARAREGGSRSPRVVDVDLERAQRLAGELGARATVGRGRGVRRRGRGDRGRADGRALRPRRAARSLPGSTCSSRSRSTATLAEAEAMLALARRARAHPPGRTPRVVQPRVARDARSGSSRRASSRPTAWARSRSAAPTWTWCATS